MGRIVSKTQLLKTNCYLPFNFTVTKIHVAIRLVEEGAAYTFNYPLVNYVIT